NAVQQISTGLRNYLDLWSAARTRGQAHRKHRALARLACHGHIAAHHARELARDGKPEPRATETLSGRCISLAELLEQLGLLLRGHADAVLGDGELDEGAAIAHLSCRKLALARRGELAGIAQQIEQDLPQSHGVDGEGTEIVLSLNDQPVLVLPGKLARGADDLVDEGSQLHGLRIEFQLAGLDLGEI